jgi:hypothetical protein
MRAHPIDPRRLLLALGAVALLVGSATGQPFGGPQDREFAADLWSALDGYADWPLQSGVYEGTSPHGAFLQMFYNVVVLDGEPYHVIVKDNHGGAGLTAAAVRRDRDQHLQAITVMVQREEGYDPANDDWFWVKYAPDGTVAANEQGVHLAGRVAKGASEGCIACHRHAEDDDYLFSNDDR